jgi:nicotinamidase-related amidase
MHLTSDNTITALLVIDVQRGLFQQSRPVHQAEQLLTNLETLIETARQADVPVIFIQHSNQKQLIRDTAAWQLHPRLDPLADEPIIHKQHGNAFEKTNLQAELQTRGVNRLLITGLVTQGCVRATCLGALKLGYQVTLVSDAHSTYSKDAPDVIEKWNQALHEKGAELRETRQVDFNIFKAEQG